ncbi:hypothetical protein BDV06DRAFT_205575 [Aspergillus oleicola]
MLICGHLEWHDLLSLRCTCWRLHGHCEPQSGFLECHLIRRLRGLSLCTNDELCTVTDKKQHPTIFAGLGAIWKFKSKSVLEKALPVVASLARVYERTNRIKEAKEILEMVLEVERNHGMLSLDKYPDSFWKAGETVMRLAALYDKSGAPEKAIKILKLILAVQMPDGSMPLQTIDAGQMLAVIYEKIGHIKSAIETWTAMWNCYNRRRLLPVIDVDFVSTTRLAALWEHSGSLDLAAMVLKRTWDECMKKKSGFSPEKPQPSLRKLGTKLMTVYERLGKHNAEDYQDVCRSLQNLGGKLEDDRQEIEITFWGQVIRTYQLRHGLLASDYQKDA